MQLSEGNSSKESRWNEPSADYLTWEHFDVKISLMSQHIARAVCKLERVEKKWEVLHNKKWYLLGWTYLLWNTLAHAFHFNSEITFCWFAWNWELQLTVAHTVKYINIPKHAIVNFNWWNTIYCVNACWEIDAALLCLHQRDLHNLNVQFIFSDLI